VGFRADGDDVNADTAANAYEWMRLTYGAGN
jgi:hypothetical protein